MPAGFPLWALRRLRGAGTPRHPGDYLFTANMLGIVSCYDARGGQVLSRTRLGKGYAASFVAADKHVYLLARDGRTTVFEPLPEPKLLAVNDLDVVDGEDFLASPAISNGQLFIRSNQMLYCIGSPR